MIYSVGLVERLLRNYLAIRYMLDGRVSQNEDTYVVKTIYRPRDQLPLGATHGQPWPFMEKSHARPPMQGKAKARMKEELHVSVLDLEAALQRIHVDDLELIAKYHIFQTHTLEELAAERHVTSRGSLQRRIQRAVERLAREMERGDNANQKEIGE